jgi:hypothetical protein
MKNVFKILVSTSILFLTSCGVFGSLTSNTLIEPNNSFVLGNNQHGTFQVKLKNVSKNNLEVYHAPITGGKHSSQMVKPSQVVTVKVDADTALFIKNANDEKANVELHITGDTGLSMGYKNQF